MRLIMCLVLLPLVTSCSMIRKLPPVKASEIRTSTSFLGVRVSADATGINNTDRTLKAADVKWSVTFPGFDHTTSAKDFIQTLPKEDK